MPVHVEGALTLMGQGWLAVALCRLLADQNRKIVDILLDELSEEQRDKSRFEDRKARLRASRQRVRIPVGKVKSRGRSKCVSIVSTRFVSLYTEMITKYLCRGKGFPILLRPFPPILHFLAL